MKILYVSLIKDGGTMEVKTDNGTYCFDNRMQSESRYALYDGYPKFDNSNKINDPELEDQIINALIKHRDELDTSPFYTTPLDHLINIKLNKL